MRSHLSDGSDSGNGEDGHCGCGGDSKAEDGIDITVTLTTKFFIETKHIQFKNPFYQTVYLC